MGIFSAGSASVNIVPDFSGAQKAIGRWAAGRSVDMPVGLDVRPGEIAKTHAEVAARPAKMHVHLDIDHKDLLKATDFLLSFSTVGKGLKGLFSPKVIGLTDLVGMAGSLSAAISQAAGAALLLPAGITAAAVPMAALVVGTRGLGDAFKALASGDVAKINEAMAKLAPSARDFVTQVHALGPAWKSLRLDVQQQLFTGLGDSMTVLAQRTLPTLRSGLVDMAGELRQTALQAMAVASSDRSIDAWGQTFANTTSMAHILRPVLGEMLSIFTDLSAVGSTFLPDLASGFAGAVKGASDWVSRMRDSGQLTQIIQVALDRIRQVFGLVMAAAKALFAVFGPGIAAGVDMINLLTDAFNMIGEAADSVAGKAGLTSFFDSLASTVRILLPALQAVFQTLFADLLPVFGKLTEALAPLAAGLLTQFADMIAKLAPLIYPALVGAVTAWVNAISPLIPVFTDILQTILPPLTTLLTQLAPIIGEIASQLGAFLTDALRMLAPLLAQLGGAFVQILQALLPLLPIFFDLIRQILPVLIGAVQILLPVVVALVQALSAVLQWLGPVIPLLLGAAGAILLVHKAMVLWKAITESMVAVQAMLKAVMATSTIGLIVIAIAALVAGLILAWKHSEAFRNIVLAVWGAIATAAQWLWGVLSVIWNALVTAWDAVVTAIKWAWENILKPVWDVIVAILTVASHIIIFLILAPIVAAWMALSAAFQWAWDNILHPLWNLIATVAQWLWTAVLQPIFGFISAAWSALLTAMQWVWNNILKPVWDAISTAANWLWHTILEPAFEGIRAAWDWLAGKFKSIYEGGIKPVFDWLGGLLETVKGGFQTAVKWIGDMWHGLIQALAHPVQVVVDFVWNNGLRGLWNTISKLWGAKPLDPYILPILREADGGIMPGYTPGRDVHRFFSPTAGWLELSGGEPVLRPEAGRVLGRNWVDGINAAARGGGEAGVADYLRRRRQGLADGGEVSLGDRTTSWVGSDWGRIITGALVPGGSLLSQVASYVSQERAVTGDRGASPIWSLVGDVFRTVANSLWGLVKKTLTSTFLAGAGQGWGAPVGYMPTTGPIKDIVQTIANMNGVGSGDQWAALDWIITHESGWRPTAQNPTSSAYGLFQFLDGTWATVGGSKTSDPRLQAIYGLRYIGSKYGSPLAAQSFWMKHGWYDQGGWLPPGYSMSYNGTGAPEAVLNASQMDRLSYMLSGASGGAGAPGMLSVAGFVNNGTVLMVDPEEQARKDKRGVSTALISLGLGQ